MNRRYVKYIAVAVSYILLCFLCITLLRSGRNVGKTGQKQRRIGSVYMTMNNPYFEVVNEEIRSRVESEGDVLLTRDSVLDSDTQNRQIRDLISEGVDLLIVNAVDYHKVKEGLKEAEKAGVPVIAVDAAVCDEKLVISSIISDNYQAGVHCAMDLMKKKKSADILLLKQENNQSARDRIDGFLDTLEENGFPYEIVGEFDTMGQLEIAEPLVQNFLKEGNKVDAVMALNDPSALGAMAALEAHQLLNHVLVYGIDGAPEAKQMIKGGKMSMTVAQSPIQVGKITSQLMYLYLNKKEIPTKTIVPVQDISIDNVDDYSLTGWQ